ncbi:adenylate kinase family protein [Kitasatospora sp. NPDC054939]
MRVVILEPPAWLHEAPSAPLARALAAPCIDFGDLIRAHLRQGTELGVRCAAVIASGSPFPGEIVTAIVHDHLRRTKSRAFVLKRHPLSAPQAQALDWLLQDLGTPLHGVVHLRLPEEVERCVRHWTAGRLCRSDPSHRFEPAVDTSVADGLCNLCGGDLFQREDDKEAGVRGRFSRYEAMVEPSVRYYAEQGLLVTVDAVGAPDEIAGRALAALAGMAADLG